MTEEKSPPFDAFELVTAVILGLAALGGAWAGYQSSLWGGNQATSFSVANNLLTKAARKVTEAEGYYSEAVQQANKDRMVFLTVRRNYIDTVMLEDEEGREMDRLAAFLKMKFILTQELSAEAYTHLELPEGLHGNKEKWAELTDDQAETAAERSLDDAYFESLLGSYGVELAEAEKLRREAASRFLEGRRENFNGDLFTFTGVLFTVCLFLAGIGLVFKTRIRWAFAFGSGLVLIAAIADLARNPWTEPTEITDAELQEAKAAASAAADESAPSEQPAPTPAPSATE